MSIENGIRCPKDIEAEIIQESEVGLSTREVASHYEVSDITVRRILDRYGKTEHSISQNLIKSTGVAAARLSAQIFDHLSHRFQKEKNSIPFAQLSVVAGIAADKANNILSKPEQVAPPDWSKLSFEDVQGVGEKVIVKAE